MKRSMCLVLLFVFGPARADEEKAAAAVEKAILAHGGESRLEALKAAVWTTRGEFKGNKSNARFSGELPGKFRLDSTRQIDGKPAVFSRVINGDKGWVVEPAGTRAMTKDEVAGARGTFYHKQLAATLVPLKHKDCKLSSLGESKVEGKAVVGVKATRKGYPDVSLYFDRETGLLVKSEARHSEGQRDKHVELYFSDYHDYDGVKMARKTRAVHDGLPYVSSELMEFKPVDRIPPAVFEKP